MANNLEDVYIRIKLDAGDSKGQIVALEEAFDKLQKKLNSYKDPLTGKLDKKDPEVQNLVAQLRPLETLIKQNRQWINDINSMIQHLSQATLKELRHGVKQLNQEMRDLTRSGADISKIETVQRQMSSLQNEIKRRNAENQPLVQNIQKLTKLTADELARSVSESGKFVQTLPKGSAEMRQMFSLYQRFREQQEKVNGQMSLGLASRLASGSKKGDLAQLQEASKYLVQYRQEWGQFMNATMGTKMDERINHVNERILQMARNIANGSVKASYADMVSALQIIKQKWETLDPNIKKNQALIATLGDEYKKLKEDVNAWGQSIMTVSQAQQAYTTAQRLLAQGETANAAAIREHIELMKQAQMVETNSVAEKQVYAEMQKKLEQQLRGTTRAELSYIECQEISRKNERATVGELQRAIDALRILAKQEHLTVEETRQYNSLLQTLEGRLKGTASAAKDLAYDGKFVADTLRNIRKAPMEDLEKAAMMLKNRLRDSQTSLQDFIKASLDLKKTQSALRGVTQDIRRQETAFSRAITKLMNYLGIFGGFYLVRQKITEAFQANLKYDESLTNIRKTTGLTSEAVAMLADNIKRIDTRTALQDMNDLAYSAGKLGVKGVSDVMGFVRAADKIKIALGEQLGDSSEAIEQLMKITNIMGVQQQYGLEDSIIRTGSALNYLTMNSQATAQPMVDFMKRIAGISTQAGVTAAELTGLAGAVNALGQPVEMSATSISKMMVQISGHSQQVAKALKMTNEETEDFMYSISSGQMMDALLMVLQKTNEAGGLSHLSTIVKDLGSSGQRVIQTIATLSENYETVSKMVRMSTDAFDQGTSVIDEYNLKQQNTAALWEKLKNNMSKLMVSTESIDYIHDILAELQGLPEAFRGMAISMKPLLELFKNLVGFVAECSWAFTGLFKAMLLHTVVTKFTAALRPAIMTFRTFQAVVVETGSKLKAFTATLRTLSWGNIFTAVFTVVFAIYDKWAQQQDRAQRNMEESIELLERTKNQAAETTANTEAMISKLKSANDQTGERKKIIDQLNQTYGAYLGHQLTEAMNNDAIAESLRQVNKELRLKALLEGQAQMNEEIDASYRTERGVKQKSLTENIANLINTEGSSRQAAMTVAGTVVNRLLEMQANGTRYGATLLDKEYDTEGNISGYKRKTAYMSGAGQEEVAAVRRTLDDLINRAISDYNQTHQNSELSRNGKFENAALEGLIDYLEVEVRRDEEKRDKNRIWNLDIEQESSAVKAQVEKDVKDYWDVISATVTQNGRFATEYVSEDIRSKDKDPWIERKNSLTPQLRQEEENMVKGFLNRIDDYMKVVQGEGRRYKKVDENGNKLSEVEANETDEYKELRARQYNAEQYLRVLEVGKVENPEGDGNGAKARRESREEYTNIIQKIKDFYEIQAAYYENQRNDGVITETKLKQMLDQNTINMNQTLSVARKRIVGEVEESAWTAQKAVMYGQNAAGEHGARAYQRVADTKDIRSIGVRGNVNGDEDGTAWINGIRRQGDQDAKMAEQGQRKIADAVRKAWMEQNPMGKITEQFQVEFETLGIMLNDLRGSAARSLEAIETSVMNAYRKIGENVFKYNIDTDEGLEQFRLYIMSFEDLACQATIATPDILREIYYKSYEYAEQYNESLSKLVDKQEKIWQNMFKKTKAYIDSMGVQGEGGTQDTMKAREESYKRMEKYGLSNRTALRQEVELRKEQLSLAEKEWEYERQRAEMKLQAAYASGDTDEIREAEALVEHLQEMPEKVRTAIDALTDSMITLQDVTMEWASSMEKAFEKFMDGFVPFRSWYEDNGSFARNVFGTKEERQKAFGEFMDDVKKTVRETIMEHVRMRMSAIFQEKFKNKQIRAEEAKADAEREMQGKAWLAVKKMLFGEEIAAKTAEVTTETALDNAETQNSLNNAQTETAQKTLGGMAQAVAKCFADLGPIAGAVAAGVVTAAIGAALTMALNAFGSKGKKPETATKTKLVTGMLTYDSGNVQSFPVMGDDGAVYNVSHTQDSLPTGMVTRPTLTTIGGVPALVGERGPEMVIGRETTRAMMMYAPDLLQQISLFDRHRSNGKIKTYDEGNLGAFSGSQPLTDRALTGDEMRQMMLGMQAALAQSNEVNAQLVAQLQRGIKASINKFGAGGLVEEVASGFVESRQMKNNKNVTRLFG